MAEKKTIVSETQAKEYVKQLLKHYPFTFCPTLAGVTTNKTPHKGDVVLFYRSGTYTHTGYVYKVSGNTYYTIEGNTSGASGVVANGGGVCKKSYSTSAYPGTKFFRPDYSILAKDGLFAGADAAIEAIIKIAENEVGYLEKASSTYLYDKTANAGNGNYTKYWKDLYPQFQAQPWCAIFVTWILYQTILKAGNTVGSSIGASGSSQSILPTTSSGKVFSEPEIKNCTGYAQYGPDADVAGSYKVTARSGLNIRNSAGNGTVMKSIPYGKTARCYGYYSVVDGVKWLLVQVAYNNVKYTGFTSGEYLEKM